MSKYFETKKGSLEDMVAGVTKGKQSEDYKPLFKKELEKAGKGIGAMSDQEKKDFFNKIDKKYTAKNEDIFTSYFQCGPEGVSDPKSSLEIASNGLIKEIQKH